MSKRLEKSYNRLALSISGQGRIKKFKAIILNEDLDFYEHFKMVHLMEKEISKTSIRSACGIDGRRRAVSRRFKLSRTAFRELANRGELPGVSKTN